MRLRVTTFFFSLLLSPSAFPQSEAGGATLNGTVTDPTGASISGAKITALKQDTGLTRMIETSQTGNFSLVRLTPGKYDLSFESPGFKTAKRSGILLAVGAVATLDVALEIGSTQETVNVTGELPLVESTRSQTATAVNEKGQVEGTCVGTGMGFDPAFYYYRPVNVFAAHGYGPVLLAGAEMIQLLKKNAFKINDSSLQFYSEP